LSLALVKTVIDVTTALGMVTVVEGVEREDQRDVLDKVGCTHMQGYLFAQPLPASDTNQLLQRLTGRPIKKPLEGSAKRPNVTGGQRQSRSRG